MYFSESETLTPKTLSNDFIAFVCSSSNVRLSMLNML